MYFLYSLQVVAATVRSVPRAKRGLEQVGSIPGAGGAAGTDQGVGLVDEQDDGLRACLDLLDHLAQPVLEFALHAGAGLEQAYVERAQRDLLEGWRDVPGGDAQRKALDDGGLAYARLTGEDGVVLAPAHEDVDQLADFLVASDDGIQLAVAGAFGEINGELFQGLLLAHLGRGHGVARLPRCRATAQVESIACHHPVLWGARDDLGEPVGQSVGDDLVELPGDAEQPVTQPPGLQDADDQVPGPHLGLAEHQGAVGPAALHCLLHVRGQVGNGAGAPRQTVQGVGEVSGQTRRVQAELADDAVQVRVLILEDLIEPVHQFHVGVAAHLAEDGGALDGLVGHGIELAEQGGAADFGHD